MQNEEEKPESPLQRSPLPPPPPLSTSTTIEDPFPKKKKPQTCCKCFKIFCCILFILIAILIGVFLFFVFYYFKTRAVEYSAGNASLESFSYTIFPTVTLNLVMGETIVIKNKNYAGFKYQNTNMTFYYHGTEVGFAPMPAAVVKPRSKKTLHTTVYMNATTMINTPYLFQELFAGRIPLQSKTYVLGKATLFNIIEIRASLSVTCEITVDALASTTSAQCKGDVKIL